MEAAMAAMANELHAPDPEDDRDFFIEKCPCFAPDSDLRIFISSLANSRGGYICIRLREY